MADDYGNADAIATIVAAIKAEDTGHTSGDKGVMLLAVRNDAGTALAGTTLDYIPVTTDATGNLRVAALGAPAALGQATMAASSPVVIASNQSAIPISSPGLAGAILQSVTTLTNATTAYPVPATPLAGRASLLIQACLTNTASVWIGSSTVTADYAATGGIELFPGQSWPYQFAAGTVPYGISTAAGQKVAAFEVAA